MCYDGGMDDKSFNNCSKKFLSNTNIFLFGPWKIIFEKLLKQFFDSKIVLSIDSKDQYQKLLKHNNNKKENNQRKQFFFVMSIIKNYIKKININFKNLVENNNTKLKKIIQIYCKVKKIIKQQIEKNEVLKQENERLNNKIIELKQQIQNNERLIKEKNKTITLLNNNKIITLLNNNKTIEELNLKNQIDEMKNNKYNIILKKITKENEELKQENEENTKIIVELNKIIKENEEQDKIIKELNNKVIKNLENNKYFFTSIITGLSIFFSLLFCFYYLDNSKINDEFEKQYDIYKENLE